MFSFAPASSLQPTGGADQGKARPGRQQIKSREMTQAKQALAAKKPCQQGSRYRYSDSGIRF